MHVRERRKFEDELLRARRDAEEARRLAEEHAERLRQANDLLEEQAVELELHHQQLQEQAAELEEQAAEMEEQAAEMEVQAEKLRAVNAELEVRTKEMERERAAAEHANQAKSSFLAVMSHELRTPLNAIGGYVQLLEMGIHGPVNEPQLVALERIERSQQHLLRLVNDVLNLARIESGRVDYLLEDIAVRDLLAEVTPMVEPQLAEKELAFEVDAAGPLRVRADREKVQQILINLLSNAIKFTPQGGRVSMGSATRADEPGFVFLRVTDTGIGIPADKQASVFEPFVQVDMSPTRSSEGTGLGLAISRDLARGMGGDLRLRSEPGRGSTFTLALPSAPAD
jgi:signal transduction histidine kinase